MRKNASFFCAVLFLFVFSPVFAGDWFVCLGSFKVAENARARVRQLDEKYIPTFISECEVDGESRYRVLFDAPFSEPADARAMCDDISRFPSVKMLGISGLWICSLEQENRGTVLEANKSEDIPLSEEKPYSVLVRSYKEEYAAENACERLKQDDVDAYVVGKYDDTALFMFDVHAGAFVSQKECEELKEELEKKGIEIEKVSDYKDFSKSIEKFDEMVKTQTVIYDSGNEFIPKSVPAEVNKCISQFPINKAFQIENVVIADFDNLRNANPDDFSTEMSLFDFDGDFNSECFHAASFVGYKDELFNRQVDVVIVQADSGTFSSLLDSSAGADGNSSVSRKFAVRGEILNSLVLHNDRGILLSGTTADGSMYVRMTAFDFSFDEFYQFMDNSYSDSSLLVYPQIRKNLFILPDESTVKRDFLIFSLERIGEKYVEERNYVDWAWGIYGHWHASAFFRQGNQNIQVGFFDLDYDYNASKIHSQFMDAHKESVYSDINHGESVHGIDGWYLKNLNGAELSFANKSYIIAVDSDFFSSLKLSDLHQFADDLRIW